MPSKAIRQAIEDYTVAVVNPHLKGVVREIASTVNTSRKKVSVRVRLQDDDHSKATDPNPAERNLQALTSSILDRLSRDRFRLRCVVTFLKEE